MVDGWLENLATNDDWTAEGMRMYAADALTSLRSMPTQESAEPVAEAMCGDHGGIQGCSCSSCGSPLGPAELTAYCNGCGIRIKWPMADGSEYMVTPPTKPDQPRVVLTDDNYNILKERMVEEHRKYGDALRPGHWAEIAARKVVSHIADFGYLAPAKPFQADEVMEVVNAAYMDGLAGKRGGMEAYRARITAKFGQQ